MLKNKKASVFLYILLLLNIALIMGYVVFNNVSIYSNNIDIGKNSEEVLLNIYDKSNIAIESTRKYNGNGNGFIDVISCPTNVTMSGTYSTGSLYETGISTQMVYEDGSIFCRGFYNSDEFRVYYNDDYSDFVKAYYDWGINFDIIDLESPLKTNTGNLLEEDGVNITSAPLAFGSDPENAADSDPLTEFVTISMKNAYIEFELASEYHLGKIVIEKDYNTSSWYWNAGRIKFYDSFHNEISNTRINLAGMRRSSYYEVDLSNSGLLNEVKYVRIESNSARRILDLRDVYIYQQIIEDGDTGLAVVVDSPEDFEWNGVRTFNDPDLTHISFDATGVGGGDKIDDNFNSDDYSVVSDIDTGTEYFAGFQDDDVTPRLTFFGDVIVKDEYYNIFWNNYKTNDFIDSNTNNNDSINMKISQADNANLFLDLYSLDQINYDIKIIEFDRDEFRENFTLLPLKTYEGKGLLNSYGYINLNSGELSLNTQKTGNEFSFNFKDRDYAIFLSNNGKRHLSYRLTGESNTGTGIYINPINDSKVGTIEVIANHIIVGGEKNFIGENEIIVGAK